MTKIKDWNKIDSLLDDLNENLDNYDELFEDFDIVQDSAVDGDIDIVEKWWQWDNNIDSHVNDDSTYKKNSKKDKKSDNIQLTIDHFAIDLTSEAKKWKLDPVIGREKEIDQVIFTLLRKSKNNPLLIWEAWVWKTAVVEGLAQKIVSWDVPDKLKNKRIMMLDMWTLVAWTKYRWDFEARFKAILDEAADPLNNIIIFIDEIHTLMWAWWAHWTDDAAQLIKPKLARWQIKLIGATTFDEYQQHLEKDAALKRRFQEVIINEPSTEVTLQILKWLRENYEEFHGVVITDKALEVAVKLSKRYILNKQLPDKAIDIIDEACARKSTLAKKLENDEEYKLLVDQIENIQKEIEKAIEMQDYYQAADLQEKINELKDKLSTKRKSKTLPKNMRPIVDENDVSKVLADKTWIPADVVSESEIQKLKRLESTLSSKILWQKEAVQAVVRTLQRNRLSVIERDKPISSFLFVWPSWVGKTYLAKLIAQEYFWDEKALIRVDMSEFMEKYSVSKLIWSAPWYVWHEQWGMLTEEVRRKPYSVVLFDEIEKADKDVLNILLQILDEWQIKDSKWRIVDFKSTIVILTSNIWNDEFAKKVSKIWFDVEDSKDNWDKDFELKKERVLERVKEFILPELLNRIDYKIVFRPLDKKLLTKIYELKINEFLKTWKTKSDIKLPVFNKQKIEKIIDEIYDPQYWVRPIEKHIHEKVEPEIIQKLMES